MDSKYNVDDILSEIKGRKLREKEAERTAAPVVSAPEEDGFRFTPPAGIIPPAGNVPPAGIKAQTEQDFPEPLFTVPERESPVERPARVREPEVAPDDGGFRFRIPEPELTEVEEKKPHSPLEFGGHVRSITDRAKIRGGNPFSGNKPPVARFEFNPDAIDEDSGLIEPKKTRSPDPTPFGDTLEHTRVIPSARDIKTGDIRKMDFGLAASDEAEEGYYEEDDGPDIREGSVVDYSEYNSESDRRDVQRDIARVKLWLFIRVALTTVLTGALFVFTLAGKYEAVPLPEAFWPVEGTMRAYFLACTVLTILVALVNSSAVGGGLMGLFKMHANSDTLAACAVLAAVGQGVAVVADPTLADPAGMSIYFSVAALAMLFNGFGKMTMINRILSNFKIIAGRGEKKALMAVESDEFCREFVRNDSVRRPVIAYSARADFFTDFLALSYSDKYDVGINRAVAPVCLCGALVVCAATYLLTGSTLSAVSALTAVLCVCATLSSTFIENVPLSKLTKKLAPQGGMVSGNKAVETFCDTRAVVLTENDLFTRGNVRLHGIRAFPGARIDEAILDAASVLCAIDGALGPVFLEMIGGNKKLLKKVDNIVFENGMGISAWVASRRVLIGNRRLMTNHGVALPAEAQLKQNQAATGDSEPLFLSNSGEVCAQFVVSYHIDDALAVELDNLARLEKQLIVYTTDANITAEKIWELYGYPAELIRILPAEWHVRYQKMSEPREKAVAEIAYTDDNAATLVKAILACVAARSSILSATVIQLVQIVLGYAIVTFMAFMGSIATLGVLQVCLYQLFWFVAIFIVQQARQS